MKQKSRIFICLFLLVLAILQVHSKVVNGISFSQISINEGLSQSTVFSIAQDRKGYMWFATYDGVNKYDGYEFTVYRHLLNDSTSLASDIARVVMSDSNGNIWVGTRKGLSCYNESKDCFENFHFKNKSSLPVTEIIELPKQILWVCVDNHIRAFDMQAKEFSNSGIHKDLRRLNVSVMKRAGDSIYLGDTSGHLYVYSILNHEFRKVTAYQGKKKIQTFLLQSPNKLWIGTEGDGLYLFNPLDNSATHYVHDLQQGSISSNFIRSLALDSKGKLWIGTFNDLNIYNESDDTFTAYTTDVLDGGSLSQRSVRCLYKDTQGGMWIGTFFGGLNYYHPLRNRFRTIHHIPYRNSLNNNIVSSIVEDEKANLWIGTNDGGVNYYDLKSGEFTYYLFDDKLNSVGYYAFESNNVKAISIDSSRDVVYVGTHAGGLKIIHRTTGRVEHCLSPKEMPATQNIYVLLPRDEKSLWVGTLEGLYIFYKDSKQFEYVNKDKEGNLISPQSIMSLLVDSFGRFWIGGDNDLQVFKLEDGSLTKIPVPISKLASISTVQCIYESSSQDIWFATRMGLYRLDNKNSQLKHYTVANGLPNNVIYGIEEDSYNFIWLSSNQGLSYLNPNTEKFRNFTLNDGLQSNQFNSYSHCCASDGTMYFGGIKGISVFRPELLIDNPFTPQVVINKLLLYNQEVRPDDKTGILKENISNTSSITLHSSQRTFTLGFVVSNYLSRADNTFAYCLEGYDDTWYYLTDKRSVSYSNLPQGKYVFRVKAANNDGKWNVSPTTLEVIILPAWHDTWWARLLYFTLFVGFGVFVFRFFWDRKTMCARLEMEHKEKVHQEEISQMKMRFFINISHELRTPLTLIQTPIQEMLSRNSDRWMRNQLKYVERNANRLLHLVNQLMDYRRAELGVFKLNVAYVNVYQLLKENFSYYEKLARHKGLEYNLVSDLEGKMFLVDAQYFELILNNLLANAFKYTDSGSITVVLADNDSMLKLEVCDTGEGIPKDKQKCIFERFCQLDSSHIGSGIGLSLVRRLVELHHGSVYLNSKEGQGSCFSVEFPQKEEIYSDVEFVGKSDGDESEAIYSTNTKEMFFLDSEKIEYGKVGANCRKKGVVLLVEDNEEIRSYLYEGLGGLFEVSQTVNGQDAVDFLKENEVDIVISDVMMPVMDGIKLCKHIKQNICTSHIPVIMLSAKSDISAQFEALQIGADDYITKPFSLALLISKIQNMMRTRQRMLEHYSKTTEVEPEKITFNAMDEELLKRAISIVEKNMDNANFSTEDFAKAMNMSRSNLHLKLKAITGESAIEFIRKIRFNEACRLLKEGRYNIAEISTKVGFNTPSYFATSFKKYMGCLPTEYVKQQK